LVLVSLEKRRLQGDLITALQWGERLIRNMEREFLPRPIVTGEGAMVLN